MKIDENMENGLYCSIDWLSFTVLDNVDLDTTIAEFGFTIEDFLSVLGVLMVIRKCCL